MGATNFIFTLNRLTTLQEILVIGVTVSSLDLSSFFVFNFFILLHQDCPALDTRGKVKEGPSKDHMATGGGERNATDGRDLEQYFSHGEGLAEVEG